ncbi:MAG: hypothetical protein ACRDHS_11570 [Actinomycetota bacterium]
MFFLAIFCLAFMFLVVPVANAYIDPGTGSFVFQALVGGILAVGLVGKVFWRRIVAFFTRRDRTAEER